MADIVVITELVKSSHKSAFIFSNKSDGTGEVSATKVDISALPGAPDRVRITKLCWSIGDGASVTIKFDRALPTSPTLVLVGSGSFDLGSSGPIEDKGTGAGTGDILLSTFGLAANSGYTIEMEVEGKK